MFMKFIKKSLFFLLFFCFVKISILFVLNNKQNTEKHKQNDAIYSLNILSFPLSAQEQDKKSLKNFPKNFLRNVL